MGKFGRLSKLMESPEDELETGRAYGRIWQCMGPVHARPVCVG